MWYFYSMISAGRNRRKWSSRSSNIAAVIFLSFMAGETRGDSRNFDKGIE
jgi:hypothetical protein